MERTNIFGVDGDDRVRYTEFVPDSSNQSDNDKAPATLKSNHQDRQGSGEERE